MSYSSALSFRVWALPWHPVSALEVLAATYICTSGFDSVDSILFTSYQPIPCYSDPLLQRKLFVLNFPCSGFPSGSEGEEFACNTRDPGWGDSPEKGMATHSSILAWRIPWTEEPGGLQSTVAELDTTEWLTLSLFAFLCGFCLLEGPALMPPGWWAGGGPRSMAGVQKCPGTLKAEPGVQPPAELGRKRRRGKEAGDSEEGLQVPGSPLIAV